MPATKPKAKPKAKPAAPAFKPGDVVRLKSGGPALTVCGLYERDPDFAQFYECWAVDATGQLHKRELPEQVLMATEPDPA